jgi:acetolactate synthase regulatory subunit
MGAQETAYSAPLRRLAMSLTAVRSPHIVGATIDRVLRALDRRGITVLARIDHGAAASAAGLELAAEGTVSQGLISPAMNETTSHNLG